MRTWETGAIVGAATVAIGGDVGNGVGIGVAVAPVMAVVVAVGATMTIDCGVAVGTAVGADAPGVGVRIGLAPDAEVGMTIARGVGVAVAPALAVGKGRGVRSNCRSETTSGERVCSMPISAAVTRVGRPLPPPSSTSATAKPPSSAHCHPAPLTKAGVRRNSRLSTLDSRLTPSSRPLDSPLTVP